jgi:hypothetical protein
MTHQIDRRRVEMSELRKLFVVARLLASRAQQMDDAILRELGLMLDKELDCMRDGARRSGTTSDRQIAQLEENHHAG